MPKKTVAQLETQVQDLEKQVQDLEGQLKGAGEALQKQGHEIGELKVRGYDLTVERDGLNSNLRESFTILEGLHKMLGIEPIERDGQQQLNIDGLVNKVQELAQA